MPTAALTHSSRTATRPVDDRPSSHRRGYDKRHRAERKMFLARNPLCVKCLAIGEIVASKVLDHIIPHRGDQKLLTDPKNKQALCVSCHNAKSAKERRCIGERDHQQRQSKSGLNSWEITD